MGIRPVVIGTITTLLGGGGYIYSSLAKMFEPNSSLKFVAIDSNYQILFLLLIIAGLIVIALEPFAYRVKRV